MIYVCKYNPKKDVKRVSPNGALNLKQAYANNSIPADVRVKDGKFNGIDDPASIAGRPSDPLDAEVMASAARGYKPPKKDAE